MSKALLQGFFIWLGTFIVYSLFQIAFPTEGFLKTFEDLVYMLITFYLVFKNTVRNERDENKKP